MRLRATNFVSSRNDRHLHLAAVAAYLIGVTVLSVLLVIVAAGVVVRNTRARNAMMVRPAQRE